MNGDRMPPIVMMGVSGSGKSTIGGLLAESLGMPFVDGDDLHLSANKAKMAAGIPLDDADRRPWLDAVGARLGATPTPVAACSALRRSYRDHLRAAAPLTIFIHLASTESVIGGRLALRRHEYMPAALLDSQYAALEPLAFYERGLLVDAGGAPDAIVAELISRLGRDGAAA
jgi:gluconokinase